MFKLMKYLKSFVVSLLIVVVLLFIQAQCELALPDYMSKIVNNGITANGISNAVPEGIRSSEFDKVAVFLSDTDKSLFLDNYKLIDRSSLSDSDYNTYQKKFPALENEPLYVINTKDKKILDQINTALTKPMLLVMTLNNAAIESIPELQQLPAGMSIYDAIKMMPTQQAEELKAKLNEKFVNMSDSNLNTAAVQAVKAEYAAIGVNLENFQNTYLFSMGGIMLIIALIGTVCAIIVGFLTAKIAAGMSKKLRNEVFTKVENFSQAEFNKFSTASLITRTTNDIQQIQMALVMILRIVVYAPIIGFGALVKVLNTNLSMTWIIGLVIVVILSIMMVAFSITMPKFKIVQKMVDRLNLVMREFLDGMLVIRAFNTQKHEEKIFDKANNDITKLNLFVNRVMVSIMPLMTFVMNSVALLIVYYGARQIDLGTLQIGDMMAFMQYSMQIIMSFLMISMISIMLPRAAVSANRVLEVLNIKAEIVDPQQPKNFAADLKGVVEFKNVSFKYPGAEVNVLQNINLIAKPGETTAFIGSTGSGKSTVINLIPRFFDVNEGQVLIDGVDVRDVKQHDLREKIGFVPQKGVLFLGTIESNLKYADENATAQDLIDAIEVAQASEFINSKPEGLGTEISQGGTNVSGGQKQRLSIARALVKKPEIYIFDDSFSALDFKTDSALRKALKVVTEKTKSTVFIVAQRISTIMTADQIVVLDKGEIAGMGTHDELMKECTVYQEIAYSQLSKEELAHE